MALTESAGILGLYQIQHNPRIPAEEIPTFFEIKKYFEVKNSNFELYQTRQVIRVI